MNEICAEHCSVSRHNKKNVRMRNDTLELSVTDNGASQQRIACIKLIATLLATCLLRCIGFNRAR